jgi:hypothetical protein
MKRDEGLTVHTAGEREAADGINSSTAEERQMQKIVPFLWFDGKAEEAMNFYVSIFKNSKVVSVTRYGKAGPGPDGTVMSATFQLEGQEFYALNGGPMFTFSPAISLFVNCETSRKWMSCGRGSPKAGRYSNAAGCRTSMVCPGKSFPLSWAGC